MVVVRLLAAQSAKSFLLAVKRTFCGTWIDSFDTFGHLSQRLHTCSSLSVVAIDFARVELH